MRSYRTPAFGSSSSAAANEVSGAGSIVGGQPIARDRALVLQARGVTNSTQRSGLPGRGNAAAQILH